MSRHSTVYVVILVTVHKIIGKNLYGLNYVDLLLFIKFYDMIEWIRGILL